MTALLDLPRTQATYATAPGHRHPLGATPDALGCNFALFSPHASGVDLLLFDAHDSPDPVAVITLDPKVHRTFQFWHVHVHGVKPGAHYAYRVRGPADPAQGQRFDPEKVLIDPYARANNKTLWKRVDACRPGDNLRTSIRSVVIDADAYDWEGDRPLKRRIGESIIYE